MRTVRGALRLFTALCLLPSALCRLHAQTRVVIVSGLGGEPAYSAEFVAEVEAGALFDRTKHGTPMLHGALAYLECRLHSAQVAGDHTIFIAEVEDVVAREGDPLLFFRGKYRKVGEDVET